MESLAVGVDEWLAKLTELPVPSLFMGVYLLYRDEEVVYVGQSVNVISRVSTHLYEKIKDFDAVKFVPCRFDELTRVESLLIDHFDPYYNNANTRGRRWDKAKTEAFRKAKAASVSSKRQALKLRFERNVDDVISFVIGRHFGVNFREVLLFVRRTFRIYIPEDVIREVLDADKRISWDELCQVYVPAGT